MNIFVLDKDPQIAAWMHDDLRLGKMLIEATQMLTTALYRHGATEDMLLEAGVTTQAGNAWRRTHQHHPCTIWAGNTRSNWRWLWDHAVGLQVEFYARRGKHHACSDPAYYTARLAHLIPDGPLTRHPLAMPDEFKGDDVVESYRRYYMSKERVVWNNPQDIPEWARVYMTPADSNNVTEEQE